MCQFVKFPTVKCGDKVASDESKQLCGHYFICQLLVVTSCQPVYCVNIANSAAYVRRQLSGLFLYMINEQTGSGIQYMSDRIMALYTTICTMVYMICPLFHQSVGQKLKSRL